MNFRFERTKQPHTWEVILFDGTKTGILLRQRGTKFCVFFEETETEYPDRDEADWAVVEIMDEWLPKISLVLTDRYRSYDPYICRKQFDASCTVYHDSSMNSWWLLEVGDWDGLESIAISMTRSMKDFTQKLSEYFGGADVELVPRQDDRFYQLTVQESTNEDYFVLCHGEWRILKAIEGGMYRRWGYDAVSTNDEKFASIIASCWSDHWDWEYLS